MAVSGGPHEIKALISVAEECTLKQMKDDMLSGAIIPALMHRIPSELRSYACLGESSTRVTSLNFICYDLAKFFEWIVCFVTENVID